MVLCNGTECDGLVVEVVGGLDEYQNSKGQRTFGYLVLIEAAVWIVKRTQVKPMPVLPEKPSWGAIRKITGDVTGWFPGKQNDWRPKRPIIIDGSSKLKRRKKDGDV